MMINHKCIQLSEMQYDIPFLSRYGCKKEVIVYIRGKYVPSNSFRSGTREISWAIFIATFLTSSTLKREE